MIAATESRACMETAPLPWIENPYRLVSLKEIMKVFQPEGFLTAARAIETAWIAGQRGADTVGELGEDIRNKAIQNFGNLNERCKELGLRMSCLTISRILGQLSQPKVNQQEYHRLLDALLERIADEMHGALFLSVEPMRSHYFEEPHLFGFAVTGSFPSTIYDVEEAGKCLALDRATACVFHLMRVLEYGVRALGASLGDPSINPDTNPTWDRILSRCKKELDKPKSRRSPDWQVDEEFYSGAAVRLTGVKDAWRNPTMHVRSKYTEEEALDVWNHVKAFMAHLATKLKEQP